jgi:hypothetical protein
VLRSITHKSPEVGSPFGCSITHQSEFDDDACPETIGEFEFDDEDDWDAQDVSGPTAERFGLSAAQHSAPARLTPTKRKRTRFQSAAFFWM